MTPLAHAALLGHGAAVHELLEHGAAAAPCLVTLEQGLEGWGGVSFVALGQSAGWDPNETVEPLRWPPVACAAWGLSGPARAAPGFSF